MTDLRKATSNQLSGVRYGAPEKLKIVLEQLHDRSEKSDE